MKSVLNLALVLAFAVVIVMWWPRSTTSIQKVTAGQLCEQPEPATPTLVMHLNPRSARNRHLVAELDEYLTQHDVPLNWTIATSRPFPFELNHRLLAPSATLTKLEFPIDSYVLFDRNGDFLSHDELHRGLGPLLETLQPMWPQESPLVDDLLSAGIAIRDSVLAQSLQQSRTGDSTSGVWVLFEDLCFVCDSGKSLEQIEDLASRFPGLSFRILLVEPVGPEQLETFIRENKVQLPIVAAAPDLVDYWQATIEDSKRDSHPLNETHLFVKQGVIQWVTREHAKFRHWLFEQDTTALGQPTGVSP